MNNKHIPEEKSGVEIVKEMFEMFGKVSPNKKCDKESAGDIILTVRETETLKVKRRR